MSILGRLFAIAIRLSVLALLVGAGLALATQYYFQEPFHVTWVRLLKPEYVWQRSKFPSLQPILAYTADPVFSRQDPRDRFAASDPEIPPPRPETWTSASVGPIAQTVVPAGTHFVRASTPKEVASAIAKAVPGTVITLVPGTYDFIGHSIEIAPSGTADAPIVLRADSLGAATMRFDLLEGLHVRGAHWTFENLVIDGVCRSDSRCEHAFHVVGKAIGTQIRNNWVTNFNAAVKVNGSPAGYPDEGLIAHNVFANDRPRRTGNPVTVLDIVAVSGWVVKNNFIADFAKLGDNRTSYGAFFKGGGSDNVFEANLVRCEWRHRGGTRIGLSFGGGGTTPAACRDRQCEPEHTGGIMRSNIVTGCPNDVGIYLNSSAATVLHNNLVLNSRGIDVRFPRSDAQLFNNVIDGRILDRDGGRTEERNNVTSFVGAVFNEKVSADVFSAPESGDLRLTDPDSILDAGVSVPKGTQDFCGAPFRDGSRSIGPFQYGPAMTCSPTLP